MKRLTVLIDADDTIENLCEVWVNFLNEKYGTSVLLSDIKEWDMTKAFPTISPVKVFEPLFDENLWKRVAPLPGAVEYVKKIIEDGHKVIIVTSSHPGTVSPKWEYVLSKYFPYMSAFRQFKEQSMKALKQQEINVLNEKEKEIQLDINSIQQRLSMKRQQLEAYKQKAMEDAKASAPNFG